MLLLLLALSCAHDADGDGHPAGADCDDDDPTAFPGAVELCDGVDQDCDGVADEDALDAPAWYVDEDSDGWGGPTEVRSCAEPVGAVATGGDCDDRDPDRSPGREEVCASGVDEDCDGLDPMCTGRTGAEVVGLALRGAAPGDRAGWSVALGDLDGDGRVEAVVGGPQEDSGGAGAAWVVWAEDLVGDEVPLAGAVRLDGEAAGDQAGRCVAAGGDVDGDGLGDLAVGASDNGRGGFRAGAAFVVSGGALTTGDLGAAASLVLVGPHPEDYAGRIVDLGGDWDGDGLADLVVGGTHEHLGGASHPGRVWLVAGAPSLTGEHLLSDAAALTLEGEADGDFLGRSASLGGDLDGDGLDDLVVGAYGDDSAGDRAGVAWLVLADPDLHGRHRVDAAGTARWLGLAPLDHAGRWVSGGGDAGGDGYDDALVGAFGESSVAGAAYLVPGGPTTASGALDEVAALRLLGEGSEERAGLGLDLGGDLDGDGLADLVVGAPRRSERAEWDGAAYVFFGRPGLGGTRSLAEADLVVGGEAAGDSLGQSVHLGGDVDGDGTDDLLLGAAWSEGGRGSAWLVRGAPW